jgi:hypothetical protein
LTDAPISIKVLVTLFLLVVGVGYVLGLTHIFLDVGFSFTGVVTHYRGDGGDLAVPPELAFARMVHVNHVHVFSLAMLFVLVGTIFTQTRLPEWVKALFVAAPYVGMVVDFSSFWLLVFVSPLFAWLAMGFGAFMAVSFFLLIGRPLYEMWVLPVWQARWGKEGVPWFLR